MMNKGVYFRKTRAPDGEIVAEYLGDNGIWKPVPFGPRFGPRVGFDSDKFNRQMARNGKKALLMTAVLAVVIVGGLAWKAIEGYTAMAAEWKAAKASIPMPIAESDFTALVVIMALSAVLAVVCWALMWESNDRYWGVK